MCADCVSSSKGCAGYYCYAVSRVDKKFTSCCGGAGALAQDEDEEKLNKLCQDKSAGELFRLKAGKDNCRDVIQCTAAVSGG